MIAGTLTAAPTWTPPPTVTAPTPFLTKTPTSQPTETATPGPSPTPTIPVLPTDDPRFGLDISSPFYWDDFSKSFTWVEWVDEITSHRVTDEHLESIDYVTDGAIWWSTTTPIGGDMYIEVTAEFGECSGRDFAGVGLRIGEDLSSGYTLEVSCDGYYRIRKFASGFVEPLLDWTSNPSIQTGTSAMNIIGFVARFDQLSAVINSEPAKSASDPTYHVGTFSLYTGAEATEGFKVSFDDFKIWFFSS